MSETRKIFGVEEIKQLVHTYEDLVDELSVTYYNQDDDAIQAAGGAVNALLIEWGLWDDDYRWRV